jgi:outer membrane protein insertion porin family
MEMRYFISLLIILLLGLPTLAQPEEQDTETGQSTDVTEKSSETPHEGLEGEPYLGPSGGQFGIGGDEGFGIGTALGDPTALYGPPRTPVILSGTDRESLIDLTGYYIHKFNEEHRFMLEAHVDPKYLGLDVSYTIAPKAWEGALTVNTWVGTGSFAPFETDGFEVRLPDGDQASIQTVGAGIEYVQPFTEELDVAFGLNYAQYAFANDLLAGDRFRTDINGFPLTVSNVGATERFVSFRTHGIFSTLNDRNLPTEGTKIRFGLEQALDIGNSSTSFNRLSGSVAHLFSAPGFTDGDHSLLLNVQGGTILGNPPPIRAFHLGGGQSVRAYGSGEMASGKSFLQTTVEYRHHLKTFHVFDTDFNARFALFHDYGTVLGTANQLQGIPPALFNKPEHGYAFGAGLQLASKYGLFRFEAARSGEGNNAFLFTAGERF